MKTVNLLNKIEDIYKSQPTRDGYYWGNPREVCRKIILALREVVVLEKKCSVWNEFKLNKIRPWNEDECVKCEIRKTGCEDYTRNRTLDEVEGKFK